VPVGPVSDAAADEAAGWLDALARRYSPALARFFQRRVTQSEDVPDLVQDVFVRLARLREYDRVHQPEQYLFTTAASALGDYFRRRTVRRSDRHEIFDAELHGGFDFSPADVLEGRQAVDCLHARHIDARRGEASSQSASCDLRRSSAVSGLTA
jgi:RNA polymerase sigma-70 factor (ECF subfamily)